jgi:copper chaperone CopZ
MMKNTVLTIDGMHCEKCVEKVKNALEKIDGVQSAQVSMKDNKARTVHGDGVSVEILKAAVVAAGFGAVA